jgi:hypothetical protein
VLSSLCDLPLVNVYLARERARRGDRNNAIQVMREAVDHLFRQGDPSDSTPHRPDPAPADSRPVRGGKTSTVSPARLRGRSRSMKPREGHIASAEAMP